MEEQELSKEDLLELKDNSKLSKEVNKLEDLIEEGGQQEEELTHWILPDDIFRTYVKESYKNRDIKWLRNYADNEYVVNLTKEDVEAYYLSQKEKLDKLDDEEFLQCLCNTGLKLSQDGKTVEQLKLMVIKR